MWCVYIVECKDGSYYTGITKNVEKRIKEHNSSRKGAKYTKAKRPVTLLASFEVGNKSKASKLEYKIKKLNKTQKLEFILAKQLSLEPNIKFFLDNLQALWH